MQLARSSVTGLGKGSSLALTHREDRRENIYFNDADREEWLRILGAVCQRFNWVCHAWCQMTNHYPIVVETPEGNLSQGMRQLNGVYTQWINRTHDRVGHVFQGRYKAILAEKDSYLLVLAREKVFIIPLKIGDRVRLVYIQTLLLLHAPTNLRFKHFFK